jgi:hypothetical protein
MFAPNRLDIPANVLDHFFMQGRGDILLGATRMAQPRVSPPSQAPGLERVPVDNEFYHRWLAKTSANSP